MKKSDVNKAIIFLWKWLKESRDFYSKNGKNTFKHSLGVFTLLRDLWEDDSVCLGGLLHDILEDTNISEADLKSEFWEEVTKLVVANTMDKSLGVDRSKKIMIQNCKKVWEKALLIKACDIYDSYLFYKQRGITSQMERSILIKEMILEECYEKELYDKTTRILNNIV